MIDIILLVILAGVTWFVASEGAWTAGTTFVCVLLAGLLAMNFFEPLTLILSRSLPAHDARLDMISLVGLFAAFVFLFRFAGEKMAPTYVQVPALVLFLVLVLLPIVWFGRKVRTVSREQRLERRAHHRRREPRALGERPK